MKDGAGLGNADALLRMNFLSQAAVLAATIEGVGRELSRFYVKTLRDVSQKLVIRMYVASGC